MSVKHPLFWDEMKREGRELSIRIYKEMMDGCFYFELGAFPYVSTISIVLPKQMAIDLAKYFGAEEKRLEQFEGD